MNPDQWLQIDNLFQAAVELPPEERPAFLEEACQGDEELRRAVESMLASDELAGSFIEAPAVAMAAAILVEDNTESLVGRNFSHYRIESLLGKGGMGEVWLAQDTKLGRNVALKLLPANLTRDSERLRRFKQEARAASALNQPNIITIHEIGQADGRHFIVTEFIDGQTLRDKLKDGRLKLNGALDMTMQIAAALAAAHAKGIVHRDVKPENVMVRRDGLLKVLDFGLAKLTEAASPVVDSQASMPARNSTEAEMVMGTPRYMSPEQARGEKVDARTDIFTLGVMLYEMVAGHAPFAGPTTNDLIAAILKDEPSPLTSFVPHAPPELERIVGKALRKNREERYQNADDLLTDLKQLSRNLEFTSGEKRRHNQANAKGGTPDKRRLATIVTLAGLVLVATVVWSYFLYLKRYSPESTLPPIKVVPLTSRPGIKMTPSFSPDGNQIAFSWNRNDPGVPGVEIYVKLVTEGEPRQLTHSGGLNFSPVWSPDGQRIAFVRCSQGEAAIFTISAYGEGERKLLSFEDRTGIRGERRISWSPDGKFLAFADSDKKQASHGRVIVLLSLDTLEKRALTSPPMGYGDEGPAFSPENANAVAFVRTSTSDSGAGADLYVVPITGGEPRRLTLGDKLFWTGPTWTENGREIVFSSTRTGSDALWRIPVSGGNPRRLEVGSDDSIQASISLHGHRLAYMRYTQRMNIYRVVLPEARNPRVSPSPFLASTRVDIRAQLSPDGKRIAFESDRSGSSREIWVCDIDGSNCAQLTSLGTQTETPRWSPDGKQIVCESSRGGKTSIYTIDIETRRVRGLIASPSEERMPSWSRDGHWVYFGSKRSGSWQIWKVPAEGGEPAQVTKQGGKVPFESPDARFVYYSKDGNVGGVWKVPIGGGEETLILDQLKPEMSENWAVVEDGIYFMRFDVDTKEGAILFSDFATGRVKEIVKLGGHRIVPFGLAVSSDHRSFFYSVWDQQVGSDVMIVENFR